MSDGNDRNRHLPFDNNVAAELGHYVYALFDPRDRKPFYVGKGGGKNGNDRVLHHFIEARNKRGNDADISSEEMSKVNRIREIWSLGCEVDWKIMRRNLPSEAEAFSVEAALIDAFRACGFRLLNVQGGNKIEKHGLIEKDRLWEFAAPPLVAADFPDELLNRPIFIFNIGNQVETMWKQIDRTETPDFRPDYIEATACCWRVSRRWRGLSDAVAIGMVAGISRAAFDVGSWEPCQGSSSHWRIVPQVHGWKSHGSLLNRKFGVFLEPAKGFMQRGGFIVCQVSEARERMFLRGSRIRYPDAPSV